MYNLPPQPTQGTDPSGLDSPSQNLLDAWHREGRMRECWIPQRREAARVGHKMVLGNTQDALMSRHSVKLVNDIL